jgi:hypothetical protein
MSGHLTHLTARSKIVTLSIALVLLLTGVGVTVSPSKQTEPIVVGMIPLLASPQKYNGKVVQTVGFLHIGRPRAADSLWLHEQDAQADLFKNSFWLDLSDDQRNDYLHLNHTYVLIVGTLRSDGPEGTNLTSGTIVRIRHISGWHPYRPSPPAPSKE